MKYNWCLGITLDGNYQEHTCKLRENCVYYVHDIFRRFRREELEEEPLMNEPGKPCQYFNPKVIIEERIEDVDPFAPLLQPV